MIKEDALYMVWMAHSRMGYVYEINNPMTHRQRQTLMELVGEGSVMIICDGLEIDELDERYGITLDTENLSVLL